jgi:hypothetical protein
MIFSLFCLFSNLATAGVGYDLGGGYMSDALKRTDTATTGYQFYFFDLLVNVDSKKKYYFGLHVNQFSTNVKGASTTEKFSTQDMGPLLLFSFAKGQYELSLGYNISVKATYSDGSTDYKWSGTSLFAAFSVNTEYTEGSFVGFKLAYYAASFNQEIQDTTATTVSYGRTLIMPMITFNFR